MPAPYELRIINGVRYRYIGEEWRPDPATDVPGEKKTVVYGESSDPIVTSDPKLIQQFTPKPTPTPTPTLSPPPPPRTQVQSSVNEQSVLDSFSQPPPPPPPDPAVQRLTELLSGQQQQAQQDALARQLQANEYNKQQQDKFAAYIQSMQDEKAASAAREAGAREEQKKSIHQLAQNRMYSLQDMLSSQQGSQEQSLKNALAQRGLLDSGSLGAGLGNIYEGNNKLLAQGSLAASQDEAGQLADIMRIASQRDYETQQALRQGIGSGLQSQLGYGMDLSRMGMQGGQASSENLLKLLGMQQQGGQFGQELGQRQSQFGTTTLMGLLGQNTQRDQFYAEMGLRRDQLSESSKQFYDDLAYRRWAQQGEWDTADRNSPSGWDYLLQALGGAAGSAAGTYVGSRV